MMKRMIIIAGLLATMVAALAVYAGDQGPQRDTTTLATNVTTVTIPVGETGRFDPEWMLINGIPSGSTQAVQYVVGGITGTVSAATTSQLIALTNIPTMFFGDSFIVTPSATLTTNDSMTAEVRGRVYD